MRAETGVGPAMASGSQVCKKNCPDLLITAASRAQAPTSKARWVISPERAIRLISSTEKVWSAAKNSTATPMSSPMSPTLLVKKALRAASELGFSSHQCPMSTNEQTPTSSQPTIICRVFSDSTKKSMAAVKSDKKAKKCV